MRFRSQRALDPYGVTPAQVRALLTIDRLSGDGARGTGGAGRAVRMGALAAALDVVPRSATDVVVGLEAAGLVERGPDPDDGRAVAVSLSPAGRDAVDAVAAGRRRAAASMFGALDEADLATLQALLTRLDDATNPANASRCTNQEPDPPS